MRKRTLISLKTIVQQLTLVKDVNVGNTMNPLAFVLGSDCRILVLVLYMKRPGYFQCPVRKK